MTQFVVSYLNIPLAGFFSLNPGLMERSIASWARWAASCSWKLPSLPASELVTTAPSVLRRQKTITVAPLGTLSLYLSKDADGIHWWPWLARAIASRWSWRCFYSLKALTVIGLHEAESRCVRLN